MVCKVVLGVHCICLHMIVWRDRIVNARDTYFFLFFLAILLVRMLTCTRTYDSIKIKSRENLIKAISFAHRFSGVRAVLLRTIRKTHIVSISWNSFNVQWTGIEANWKMWSFEDIMLRGGKKNNNTFQFTLFYANILYSTTLFFS